jgi:hypothetical protein
MRDGVRPSEKRQNIPKHGRARGTRSEMAITAHPARLEAGAPEAVLPLL